MWEPRRGRVSGGGVHPPLLPRVVGESRGVFVLCWPGVTTWGSALLSPPGAKTRLATGSQGSGGWGQLGALHLHPHYLTPSWAGPVEDVLCARLRAATASRSTHISPARCHTRWYRCPLACLGTPKSCDLPKVPRCSAHYAVGYRTRPATHQPRASKPRLRHTCMHRCVTTLPTAWPQALCGGGSLGGPPPLSRLLGAGPGGGEACC